MGVRRRGYLCTCIKVIAPRPSLRSCCLHYKGLHSSNSSLETRRWERGQAQKGQFMNSMPSLSSQWLCRWKSHWGTAPPGRGRGSGAPVPSLEPVCGSGEQSLLGYMGPQPRAHEGPLEFRSMAQCFLSAWLCFRPWVDNTACRNALGGRSRTHDFELSAFAALSALHTHEAAATLYPLCR